jgi:hypothetical protein
VAPDWFRKSTWGPIEAADFEARLKRARATSRPQYLYIQAHSLLESGRADLLAHAIVLADRSIAAGPPYVHASANHGLKGMCFERLGDLPSALSCYLSAVDTEKIHRGILTDAYLDFCWAVAVHRIPDHFERALALLDDFADRRAFPVQRFRAHAVRALIANALALHAIATAEAQLALQAADVDHSGLSHHPTIGIVNDRFQDVRQQLDKLAAAG